MNAASFIENFDHLANAPHGISRIREMIYYLAVTARLSGQLKGDGDAQTLLAQICAERDRRIANKEFKRSPKLENISDVYNQNLPSLPNSWTWTRLVDIGEISPKNDCNDDEMASFVSMSSISERHRVDVTPETRSWGNVKKGYTHFANGDVCVAKITPCFENGKAAAFVNLSNNIGAGTTELHVVRVLPGVDPIYVYVFLRSPFFRAVGEQYMTGTAGQKRLPSEYFATRSFPLPPLEEQQRIVAKVDDLMGLCDKLEVQQQERERRFPVLSRASNARFREDPCVTRLNTVFGQRLQVPTADLEESILSLAVDGSLVEQNTADRRVNDVLRDLEKSGGNESVRRGVPSEVSRPRSISVDNLPSGWAIESVAKLIRLGAIIDLKDGNHGANHPKVADFTDDGLPFITATNVSASGLINYEGAYKVSGQPLERLRVGFAQPGDVIYTHKGSVGRVAVCIQECILSPQTTYYRPNREIIDSEFLRLQLLSPQFRSQVDEVKAQTTRDFVPIKAQYNFFIRVPSLDEQRRIVSKTNELLNRLKKLNAQLLASAEVAAAYARAAVNSITGTKANESVLMNTPKTELVSILKMTKQPKATEEAVLANILQKQKGELSAKALWRQSGLEIDAFYLQLRNEIAAGWIVDPKSDDVYMKEVVAD